MEYVLLVGLALVVWMLNQITDRLKAIQFKLDEIAGATRDVGRKIS
jgi:hypothetical protein